MKLLSPELWLQQAKADRAASRASGLSESHRRYLLQQTYEKAIKALGLACLSNKQSKDKKLSSAFGSYFLHHHTPMTVFSATDDVERLEELRTSYGSDAEHLLNQLKIVRKQIVMALERGADAAVVKTWKKIDATRPTKSVDAISYRYPFVEARHPDGVAPSAWNGWDGYQGRERDVRDAVDELFVRAGARIGDWLKQV